MKRVVFHTFVALGVLGAVSSADALAQGASWEHTLAVYMVGAALDGKAGVRDVTADVDVSFSDILDNLDAGFMFAYRGERGPWSVVLDFSFMELEGEGDGLGPAGGTRGRVETDQYIVQLDVGHALSERLSAYGGVRYTELDLEVEVAGGGPLGATLLRSGSENWADPVIGLRYAAPIGERWLLVAKGDVGGFGVASDFTWAATAFASYSISRQASLLLGYRHIYVDYEDGSGDRRFAWEVTTAGPSAGFAWRF